MTYRLLISFLLLVGSVVAAFGASPIPPVIRSTRFNGNLSQAVSYAPHPALNLTNAPMTVEAWVFREDATRCETIASRGFTDSWWLGFCGKLRFYRGGSSADADVEVPADQWTHVAASYDGARVRFYVDGILRGDKPLARGTVGAARGVVIGGDPSPGPIFSAGYPFKGYLDEVRIWSVARTAAELGAGRFREVRGVPGLVVAFSEGGEGATLPDLEPLSTVDVSRLSGFGIVPRDLKVPVGSFPVTLDGEVFLNTEYSGAEQMVMRYSNGPDVRDVPIYLINSGTTNSPKLNIAALGLRFPAVPFDQSGITIFMHSNTVAGPTRGTGDSAFTIPFAGSPKGVRYVSGGPDVAFTTDFFWKEARSLCLGEFDPPCVETLISTLGLGLGRAQRIMIQQYGDPAITGRVNAPSDTSVNQPSSWPELTYIEVPNTNARSIVLFVQAQNPFSWNPDEREYSQILSRRVSFYSGDSSLGGLPVFSAQMWRGDWVNAVTLADRNLTVKLHLEPGDTLLDISFQSRGGRLIRTNAPGEYVFGLCTNAPSNRCEMGLLYFNMLPDLGPLVVTNISTNQLALPVTVRDRPRKIAGGGTFRVHGTNLHSQIEAYLSICSSNRILTCLAESNSIPLEILGVGGLRDWVDLRIPELPRRFWGSTMTVWIRDRLPSREHFGTEWNRVPGPAGEVTLVPPPWPDLYGFEFENRGNFTSPEEFEATYGESVFTYIPLPPFKVRDPYYYTIWWWMYLALADIADGGSCHGFAAASQLYFRGLIPISKYDLSTNGVHYPTGFPSLIVDGRRVPFGAPRWSGFDLFKPFEPVNLWAQIRVYMMAQFSDEALGNTVSQVRLHSFLGSDPNEQLARMAAAGGVRGFILCFNPGGIGTGHCVTPYEVVPDMGLDPESNHMVPKAGHSVIKVYDNNWPETERYMMVEPRSRGGYYTYRLGPET
ncbi:MAG: LamG domain-containing protein, partial [Verrucomicrobia bacterium]|nr:LamG domain-containing protein [Verrucomicrobiota bacterium]